MTAHGWRAPHSFLFSSFFLLLLLCVNAITVSRLLVWLYAFISFFFFRSNSNNKVLSSLGRRRKKKQQLVVVSIYNSILSSAGCRRVASGDFHILLLDIYLFDESWPAAFYILISKAGLYRFPIDGKIKTTTTQKYYESIA